MSERFHQFDEADFLEKLGLTDPKILGITKIEVIQGVSSFSFNPYKCVNVYINELEEKYYNSLQETKIGEKE